MYCIDATKRRTSQNRLVWHYDKIRRSISTPAIKDGIVYEADFSAFCTRLTQTGRLIGRTIFLPPWGSPMLIAADISW